MATFKVPELVVGALLAVAIFSVGYVFRSEVPGRAETPVITSTTADGPVAQDRRIADYTEWLAIFTAALVAVSAVQIFFLGRADRTARISADAARLSSDTSREALTKSQRAFVRVRAFPWLWREDTDRPGKFFFDIMPEIENAGSTPTVEASLVRSYALTDEPLPRGFTFPYEDLPGTAIVGPQQVLTLSNIPILDDDLLAVQRGTKFFYIWGTIDYRDVFDSTPVHTTEFGVQIGRVMGNPLDPRDPHNPRGGTVEIHFRNLQEHNSTT
jgi:hypothetical protein